MFTQNQVHNGINIGIHVWILFLFLTIFFFVFISKKERGLVSGKLDDAISKNVPTLLQELDTNSNKLGVKVDWKRINDIAGDIQNKYGDQPDPAVEKNNKKLLNTAIAILVGLFCVIIGCIFYFYLYKGWDIGLKNILIDNAIVMLLVGSVEAFFFITVAFKYVPVTTTDMVNEIFNRTEQNIEKQLG